MSLLKDENEAKIGLISVVRDISKRKLSEIALEQSEKRYRNVVEYQTDIVFRFKPDGSITFMNETFRKLFQKNFKGERKKTWYSVLHKSDIRDIKHQLQEISLNKPTVILESRVWSADGALRWMQFVNRGFFEENGRLYEIQSVGRDITELKRMTQELEIKEKDLEAKHERLSELNAALKVLLDQREQEKNNFEEQLSKNINGLIIPYLIKIKKTGLNNLQTGYIENLESNLRLMTNPYIRGISFNLMQLSATETMVAELIKQGYRIKEIALRLNISPRTVEFHRTNIRKKLAIKGRKINLRTYLTNAS
ncbi:PAS domain S-box protein [Desulfatiglans anilini]|uniref:PAS domain S-box protein n=1 Tax=Desulfatiglans anilini TaxID=90728 RepID=UPI000489E16E|nr:PAS domain S-box protein [Desulfatiglans anilini]